MKRKMGFFRRLSSVGNFDVPKHTGLDDLVFDSYKSIQSALVPAFSDPVVIVLSIFHIASYVYFIRSVFGLSSFDCVTIGTFFAHTLPSAVLIQFLWSVKAVYLLDKAVLDDRPSGNYLVRWLRSTILALPFSYLPSWLIGCLCWPFIPIRLYGSGKFYDHSLVIGHYVQLSLLYVGGRNDSFSNNLDAFCDIANTSRSRYWDIFEEASGVDIFIMLVLGGLCLLGWGFVDLNLESIGHVAGMGVSQNGFWLFLYVVLSCMVFNVVHTIAIAAASILEFSRTTRQVPLEDELPPARSFEWAKYIPHLGIGVLFFGMMTFIVVPESLNFRCNKPVAQFERIFRSVSQGGPASP